MSEESYKIYRGLQIMNSEFNHSFASVVIPLLLFLLFYCSILCSLILINFHSSLHIFYFIVFTFVPAVSILGILVMFPMVSKIYATSLCYIKVHNGQKRSDHAFLRSCTSLRVWIGPFFIFTKTTTISGIGLIAYFTLRLVAAL